MNTLGGYLKSKRKEKGISIRELAKMSGLSHSYISQIENGKYETPKKSTVIALSKALNISRVEPLRLAGFISEEDFEIIDALRNQYELEEVSNTLEKGLSMGMNLGIKNHFRLEEVFQKTDNHPEASGNLVTYKDVNFHNKELEEILNFIEYVYQKKKQNENDS